MEDRQWNFNVFQFTAFFQKATYHGVWENGKGTEVVVWRAWCCYLANENRSLDFVFCYNQNFWILNSESMDFQLTIWLLKPSQSQIQFHCEAVNIEQRPGSHPMCHWLLPTLLRGSSMWLMKRSAPLTGEDPSLMHRYRIMWTEVCTTAPLELKCRATVTTDYGAATTEHELYILSTPLPHHTPHCTLYIVYYFLCVVFMCGVVSCVPSTRTWC